MSLLEDTLARIKPADDIEAMLVAEELDEFFPARHASAIRSLMMRYIRATGESDPWSLKPCTIICCADHGVAAQGVSAYPPETTVQMTANYLIAQGAAANAFATFAHSDLLVVDMGIAADTSAIPGLVRQYRIAPGTRDMTQGAAMTRAQARAAVETGIKLADAIAAQGYNCFLPGEMGISNTTASACIAATLCGLTAEQATGRGTNISDERLQKKISVVKMALLVNQPDASDGLDVLAKVGGFELGAIAGLMLGAAANHAVTILDAFNSSAAALIAQALAPAVTDYLLPSHQGGERAHGAALAKLGLTPHLFLDIKLGEACGSSITARFLALGLAELDALHAENGDKDIDANLYLERMPAAAHSVTDRTFNFYLKTMPDLDKNAMRACQTRLDHLAKPLYSLGHLESIATEAAGIACEERPEFDLATLLLFSTHKETEPAQRILSAASRTIPMAVTVGRLRMGLPPTAAFDFGRNTAEDLAFETSVIGLGLTDDASARLAAALLTDDGDLRYPADEFLAHVPEDLQLSVSALIGAIIAAAHNSSLILPSDGATELVTRYVEELAPSVRPYILHLEGTLTSLGDTLPGITACAGALIVEAALAMLNHMKTFEETKVAIANDGPGAEKQKR